MTIIPYNDSMKEPLLEMLSAYFPEVDADIPEEILRGKLIALIQSQHDRGILQIRLAIEAEQAVGFSIFQIDTSESDWCKRPGWGFIREFYIRPPFRKRGFGHALARDTEQSLRRMGARQMYLTSGKGISFWKSCGWQETGEVCTNQLNILEK